VAPVKAGRGQFAVMSAHLRNLTLLRPCNSTSFSIIRRLLTSLALQFHQLCKNNTYSGWTATNRSLHATLISCYFRQTFNFVLNCLQYQKMRLSSTKPDGCIEVSIPLCTSCTLVVKNASVNQLSTFAGKSHSSSKACSLSKNKCLESEGFSRSYITFRIAGFKDYVHRPDF
jgi:hypothetical protein